MSGLMGGLMLSLSAAWADITGKPATFPPSAHTHAWGAEITSTPTTLAGYGITDAAALSHTHTLSQVTDAGTMAAQNKTAVDIDGGTIDGAAIGAATPAPVTGSTLKSSSYVWPATGAILRPDGALAGITLGNAAHTYRADTHTFTDSAGTTTRATLSSAGLAVVGWVSSTVYTVATLPTGAQGRRAFVSDANATTFASVVAGGGSNKVPVYHDGTNWRIG